jgi:dimethylhistidine N-methyltransferase
MLRQRESEASALVGAFAQDLMRALAQRPRSISPKYFYDAEGSRLFDRICELPEYYPTRTELAILSRHAGEIAALMGPRAEVVEFGAGSLRKVRLLLAAMESPARYLPIDISGDHLRQSASALKADEPGLDVLPVVADYTQHIELPPRLAGSGQRVGFFPGSTIGNFTPEEAEAFLRSAARALRGGALLLGADLVKEPAVLHAAYNDAQGVTAAFNLNLLERLNHQLAANFPLNGFEHRASYNSDLRRIEMRLVAREPLSVTIPEAGKIAFAQGESILTEVSYKYDRRSLDDILAASGLSMERWMPADDESFALALARARS